LVPSSVLTLLFFCRGDDCEFTLNDVDHSMASKTVTGVTVDEIYTCTFVWASTASTVTVDLMIMDIVSTCLYFILIKLIMINLCAEYLYFLILHQPYILPLIPAFNRSIDRSLYLLLLQP